MTYTNRLFIFLILSIFFFACQSKKTYTDEIYQKPVIDPNPKPVWLSPDESRQRIFVPKGYRVELVASEPMVQEPVAIAWDGNGRMYVAQMMTYMQDVDGTNENMPWSRISRLEDTDGDGVMDKSSVFIDSLILPRIMLPLDDRVIVGETFQRSLYAYRDMNDDGIADEKILLLEDTVKDFRNLEHQDANMLWSIDNWLYLTNKAFRYRFANNTLLRDTLPEPLAGQWGLTQDETGRLFLSRAGAEVPALSFQQHPIYGSLELEGRWDQSFPEPWPIVGTPDAQGGPRRLREKDNTLNRFTGVSGQAIFLGDKLPAYGDLFIPEPVGRLVRRAKVNHVNGKIILKNAYVETEFLASTDPLFRPVYAATGPDGCLYIVDMYHGIIQEGTWVGEGSYLRDVVKAKGLDQFTGMGRIYRVVHEEMKPGPKPKLLGKSAAELTKYLSHPNGWWRMTAQKLLILKNDRTVVRQLHDMVRGNESLLTQIFRTKKDYGVERLHALWTLEGLNAIDKPLLKKALLDKDSRVKVAAIRISERYLKKKDQEIFAALKELANDEDPEVLQQLILSLRVRRDSAKAIIESIVNRYPANEVLNVTAAETLNPRFSQIDILRQKYRLRGGDEATQVINGYKIYQEICSACHGPDGKGIDQLAPPLAGSPRVTGDERVPINILLNGLTGPVDGKEYSGVMAPISQQSDEYIADVLTYIRLHLNNAGTIWRGQVRFNRDRYKDRKKYWTIHELKQTFAK